MEVSIEWGAERKHDGSGECPADARDMPCMVFGCGRWQGRSGDTAGLGWYWSGVTAYRLPVSVTAPAADLMRDALVMALERLLTHYVDMANSGDAGFWDCEEEPVVIAARAALTKLETNNG